MVIVYMINVSRTRGYSLFLSLGVFVYICSLLPSTGDQKNDLPLQLHLNGKTSSWWNFFFFVFLGPHSWHVEVPRLGGESELQLPAYATATATATWDLSHICDLCLRSWKHQIINPLSVARDWTLILIDTSRTLLSHIGNSLPRPLFIRPPILLD